MLNVSNEAILISLGKRLAEYRLNMNISQATLSDEAGISRKTLYNIENGKSVQLENLIRILRALGQLEQIENLLPVSTVSPISLADRKGSTRQRASSPRKTNNSPDDTPWSWPDDQ